MTGHICLLVQAGPSSEHYKIGMLHMCQFILQYSRALATTALFLTLRCNWPFYSLWEYSRKLWASSTVSQIIEDSSGLTTRNIQSVLGCAKTFQDLYQSRASTNVHMRETLIVRCVDALLQCVLDPRKHLSILKPSFSSFLADPHDLGHDRDSH